MRQSAHLRVQATLGSSFLFLIFAWSTATPGSSHACRFWALTGADYPDGLIEQHLRSGTVSNMELLGSWNANGWAFAAYLPPNLGMPIAGPLIRRGGPPASHPTDPDFDHAVDELVALRPRCVLGHVRAASSGLWGIPDPHPFQHAGFVFAHNGSLPAQALVDALLDADPTFFETHPPDYMEAAIDSEIYFLYLVRTLETHPELSRTDAILTGVREIALRFPGHRLNFVMSRGDTLWALRHAPGDQADPVRYLPAVVPEESNAAGSPFWCVASQIVGSTQDGWGTIPMQHLGVFVPGRPPQFIPIEPTAPREAPIDRESGVGQVRIQAGEQPR